MASRSRSVFNWNRLAELFSLKEFRHELRRRMRPKANLSLELLETRDVPAAVRPDMGFTSNTLGATDDGTAGPISLGFTVDVGGTNYSQLYVNNNGNVTFDAALSSFLPVPLTSVPRDIIAPFWSDVDTRVGNTVTYGTSLIDGHAAFGVNWPDVGYFSKQVSKLNDFQLVIIDRSDIASGAFLVELNFDSVEWDVTSSTPARVGYSFSSGLNTELPGSGTSGAFLAGGANDLLIRR